jgi:hypothetical protein
MDQVLEKRREIITYFELLIANPREKVEHFDSSGFPLTHRAAHQRLHAENVAARPFAEWHGEAAEARPDLQHSGRGTVPTIAGDPDLLPSMK